MIDFLNICMPLMIELFWEAKAYENVNCFNLISNLINLNGFFFVYILLFLISEPNIATLSKQIIQKIVSFRIRLLVFNDYEDSLPFY